MLRASRPTRLSDPKLPGDVAHASVVCPGGSIAYISGDKALVLCQPESQRTPLVCSSRRRRGSPLYLGSVVTPSPQTRGEVAVLGRLAMCRPTAEPHSCLTGASSSRGHRLSIRYAHRPFTSCASLCWSLPTMPTLRPAHVWTGRRTSLRGAPASAVGDARQRLPRTTG